MRYRRNMQTATATTLASNVQSIAGFVRAQPVDMPADEVIALGRAQGLDIKRSNVHTTRYLMKPRAADPAAKRATPRTRPRPVAVASAPPARATNAPTTVLVPAVASATAAPSTIASTQAELIRQMRGLAARIGLDRARAELDALDTLIKSGNGAIAP